MISWEFHKLSKVLTSQIFVRPHKPLPFNVKTHSGTITTLQRISTTQTILSAEHNFSPASLRGQAFHYWEQFLTYRDLDVLLKSVIISQCYNDFTPGGAIQPATAGKGKTVPVARTTYGNNDPDRMDAAFRRRLQFPRQNESINDSRAVALPAPPAYREACTSWAPCGGGFNRYNPNACGLTI